MGRTSLVEDLQDLDVLGRQAGRFHVPLGRCKSIRGDQHHDPACLRPVQTPDRLARGPVPVVRKSPVIRVPVRLGHPQLGPDEPVCRQLHALRKFFRTIGYHFSPPILEPSGRFKECFARPSCGATLATGRLRSTCAGTALLRGREKSASNPPDLNRAATILPRALDRRPQKASARRSGRANGYCTSR